VSSEAVAWAFKQDIKPSSLKFTLVAMAECANYQSGLVFASTAHLCEITGQDRKTVLANQAELEKRGLIEDTGERTGKTKQIKVYRPVIGTVPETEQYQERNSTVSPPKQSQKRDTEPSSEPSSPSETSSPQVRRARQPAATKTDFPEVPPWIPAGPWNGYLEMRKRAGKPPTPRAMELLLADLDRWRDDGHDPGDVLDNSTKNNWIGLFQPKEQRNGTQRSQAVRSSDRGSSDRRSTLARVIDEGLDFLN
jgi:hypothetical protein